jgi:phenylalanyl-tRNA synthetase beta chain
MLVSYNWLQEEYFDDKLPDPKDLVDLLTMRAFEVESVEKKGDDYLIDIDVLPNRMHDCLSHRGIARELGVILNLQVKSKKLTEFVQDEALEKVSVRIKDEKKCRRYIGRPVFGVNIAESPAWLKERLESIGQRSINNVVDLTNYSMWNTGQPLHAFDADKVAGGITVRTAKLGEKITTLDNKEVELTPEDLVIADDEAVLAIAGVKGGKKAEVDSQTKNIILESANFDPVSVRKTRIRTGIQTDSSKRFENEPTPELAFVGMNELTAYISDIAKTTDTKIGEITDVYPSKPTTSKIAVSLEKIQNVLGVEIPEKEVTDILDRFGFEYSTDKGVYTITPSLERLDLTIPEDIIEEIGRVYGYENVADQSVADLEFAPKVNKVFFYTNKIKQFLAEKGFSEIFTSSFRDKGAVAVTNPMAQDKAFLRTDITQNMSETLERNVRNADLLGVDSIQMVEIGKVFPSTDEELHLAVGIQNAKSKKQKARDKDKETLQTVLKELGDAIGASFENANIIEGQEGGVIAEINLDPIIEKLSAPESYGNVLDVSFGDVKYKPISPYPFVTRDIAVFVPEEVDADTLEKLLTEESGELLARAPRLFDVFKKEGEDGTTKVSYAFALVFQSYERTLTDEEVNKIMDTIYARIEKEGWEVR